MKALVIKAGMADEVRERILTGTGRWAQSLCRRCVLRPPGKMAPTPPSAGMERDLHQHPRRTGSDRRCAELLGFSVRPRGRHRASRGFSADPAMAVVVADDRPERSGVAFTADPTTPTPPTGWSSRVPSVRAKWCPGRWSRHLIMVSKDNGENPSVSAEWFEVVSRSFAVPMASGSAHRTR